MKEKSNGSRISALYSDFLSYLQIGGYPEVVSTYLETEDVRECLKKIEEITQVFIKESTRYLGNPLENEIFRKILGTIAVVLLKEKKGNPDLATEFSKLRMWDLLIISCGTPVQNQE